MGGCVSKQGEAQFDANDAPYVRASKKRKSWRKSKKASKEIPDEIPVDDNGEVVIPEGEKVIVEVDEEEKSKENTDNEEEKKSMDSKNDMDRPIPLPRRNSRGDLVCMQGFQMNKVTGYKNSKLCFIMVIIRLTMVQI